MLKTLELNRFGRFADEMIEFGPVTVISGENEAGKTTIFDALLDSLCSPGGNTREGRMLLTRYGAERDVEPVFEGERLSFDASEFLNLYALRSSEIELAMDDRSDWMQRVKARLFSGGIDPNHIRTVLEGYSSADRRLEHNRQLDRLGQEKVQAEAHLAELHARRDDILLQEKETQQLMQLVRELEQKVQEKRCEIDELEKQLEREDKVTQRKRLDGVLAFINEGRTLKSRIQGLAAFEQDRTGELDALQQRGQELQTDQRVKESAVAGARTEVEKAKVAKDQLEEKAGGSRQVSELAAQLVDRVSSFLARPPMTLRIHWNVNLVVVGAALFVAGILAAALLDGAPVRAGAFSVGAVLCAVLILMARSTEAIPDEHARAQLLAKTIDDWGNAGFNIDDVKRQTLEGLQEVLLVKRNEHRDLVCRITQADSGLREAQGRLESEAQGLAEVQTLLGKQKQEIQEWFRGCGCTGRDAYVTNVAALRGLKSQLSEWEQRLGQYLKQEDCRGTEDLQRLCDRRLRNLDEEGIPCDGRTEVEVTTLRNELDSENRTLEQLIDRLRTETGDLENRKGKVSGSLGDLPEQILKAEAEVQESSQAIAANLLNRKAAQMAAAIFGQIAEDANVVMEELGHDFGRWLGSLIPGDREVRVSELNMSAVSVADVTGTLRSVDSLSCGTKACLVLAARLALARRARQSAAGLLVLDEPFVALDSVRRTNALTLLKSLYDDNNGWQIILLTKDAMLVEELRSLFPPDVVRYHILSAL